MNGPLAAPVNGNSHHTPPVLNGIEHTGNYMERSVQEYERELPFVFDGQVPLGDLISRVVREIYTELGNLAETLPAMSDQARKRKIADFVVAVKKQVVKLYALVKWARDADDIQKCMNITAFLMSQNNQFELAIAELAWAKESLAPARLRNHDLLTSLDVLTTGSYRRLPSFFESVYLPAKPLTNLQIRTILLDLEDVIRFRLHTKEIVPVEMKDYRIENGRVYFTATNLFETSLIITGAGEEDGWGFVHVKFLFNVPEQEGKAFTEFPCLPPAGFKEGISLAAHDVLAPRLPPEGVIDTPFVRVFNLLQMLSLTYQLEILFYQAQQMMSLGWKDYMTIEMARDRRSMTITYWIRKRTQQQRSQPPNAPAPPPPQGGTLTISIFDSSGTSFRSPVERVRAELQELSRCTPGQRFSDQVEGYQLKTTWEPTRNALGVQMDKNEDVVQDDLQVNSADLDLEKLILKAIRKHGDAILRIFYKQLVTLPSYRNVFADDEVSLFEDASALALRVNLCEDQVVIITIDARTGRINLRDTGDLAAAGRGPRFFAVSDKLNEQPAAIPEALVRLRYSTIVEYVDHKASYLGLSAFKLRNLPKEEINKFGASRGLLFIQLADFPSHYLVLIIADEGFKFALISVKQSTQSQPTCLLIDDFGWLDVAKMKAARNIPPVETTGEQPTFGGVKYSLETHFLRELHAYCCARVCHTKIEGQLKARGINYTHVLPTPPASDAWNHVRSSLARSVPVLCVQSGDLLAGAAAAEAAMPNIRIEPINWWSERKCQVVTSVKLKYSQRTAGGSSVTIIGPSDRIMFDTTTSVVCFLSDNVDDCVGEFLVEWTKVSKVVIIAREVSTMKKWSDVRLLSFDLETVQFTYSENHAVAIRCTTEPSGNNTYQVRFSTSDKPSTSLAENPSSLYSDMAVFIRSLLKNDGLLAASVHDLVALLRDSLPVVLELDEILSGRQRGVDPGAEEALDVDVDVFPKGAGWFRILYGDLRHALDIRLMKDKKVLVMDGSQSVFGTSHRNSDLAESLAALVPIPGLENIVEEVVRVTGSVGVIGSEIGVLCEAAAVRNAIRTMHRIVLRVLVLQQQ